MDNQKLASNEAWGKQLKDRLVRETKYMRDLQKKYFEKRDKIVLGQSKQQEKKVDQLIEEILLLE